MTAAEAWAAAERALAGRWRLSYHILVCAVIDVGGTPSRHGRRHSSAAVPEHHLCTNRLLWIGGSPLVTFQSATDFRPDFTFPGLCLHSKQRRAADRVGSILGACWTSAGGTVRGRCRLAVGGLLLVRAHNFGTGARGAAGPSGHGVSTGLRSLQKARTGRIGRLIAGRTATIAAVVGLLLRTTDESQGPGGNFSR
jgi:hypothetical protein